MAEALTELIKRVPLFFDLDEREEKTVLDEADRFEVTFDGKKMLVESKHQFAIVEIKEKQKFEQPMNRTLPDLVISSSARSVSSIGVRESGKCT